MFTMKKQICQRFGGEQPQPNSWVKLASLSRDADGNKPHMCYHHELTLLRIWGWRNEPRVSTDSCYGTLLTPSVGRVQDLACTTDKSPAGSACFHPVLHWLWLFTVQTPNRFPDIGRFIPLPHRHCSAVLRALESTRSGYPVQSSCS